jgi:hypothetical protein
VISTNYGPASGAIVFAEPPPANATISVFANKYHPKVLNPPQSVFFTGDGNSTLYRIGPENGYTLTHSSFYKVYISGVAQRPERDYMAVDVNGGSILFTTPPPAGANIHVEVNQFGSAVFSVAGRRGDVVLTSADIFRNNDVSTLSTPVTASGDFITITLNNKLRYIRLWDSN